MTAMPSFTPSSVDYNRHPVMPLYGAWRTPLFALLAAGVVCLPFAGVAAIIQCIILTERGVGHPLVIYLIGATVALLLVLPAVTLFKMLFSIEEVRIPPYLLNNQRRTLLLERKSFWRFELVEYEAHCPDCDSLLITHTDKRNMRRSGEIAIARCVRHPDAHVYTLDTDTRQGRRCTTSRRR